jgi:hypothetical protein
MGPFVLVPLLLGVIFTISAANTSGTDQALSIVLAGGLYLLAAFFVAFTVWIITHPYPADDDTPATTTTNRPEDVQTQATRQQIVSNSRITTGHPTR